jgi:hypothetical protein
MPPNRQFALTALGLDIQTLTAELLARRQASALRMRLVRPSYRAA